MRLNYRDNKEEIRSVLYAGQSGQCIGCLDVFAERNFELDHIEPQDNGGSNDIRNIQLLCSTCNRSKSRKTQAEFLAQTASLRIGKTPLFSNVDYDELEKIGVSIKRQKDWDKRMSKPMTKRELKGVLGCVMIVAILVIGGISSGVDSFNEWREDRKQQKQRQIQSENEEIERAKEREKELERIQADRLRLEEMRKAMEERERNRKLTHEYMESRGYRWDERKGYIPID